MKNDVTNIGIANSGNVTNVTIFEDFNNAVAIPEGGTSADPAAIHYLHSDYIYTSSGSTIPDMYSETNHPGIITFSDVTGASLQFMRSNSFPSGATYSGGIPVENYFSIVILSKCIYNASVSSHDTTYNLISDGGSATVTVNAATGVNAIQYSLLGLSGTTTIPSSNTWFKIEFRYSPGTIQLYIDGSLIDSNSGTFSSNTGGYLDISCSESGASSMSVAIDYILANYQVTR